MERNGQHQFYLNINNDAASPFLRRPHTKSRSGCANCKASRIKCGEEQPQCRNCVKKGKTCHYQTPKFKSKKKEEKATRREEALVKRSPSSPEAALSQVSGSFTLHDLRLFHHFLAFAHPSLPLGNESVWIQDIPQLMHVSDHLMHALLALGASHIGSLAGTNHDECNALLHKGQAIAGLKEAFAQSQHSSLEYDLMLATCYALAFQSALVPSGAVDFATFVRGCALLTERIQQERKRTIFSLPAAGLSRARTQTTAADNALASGVLLQESSLSPLLTKGVHCLSAAHQCLPEEAAAQNFYGAIHSTLLGFQISPSIGYDRFLGFYAVWFKLVDNTLQHPTESVNEATQVLWAFFIGLQLFTVMLVDECLDDHSDKQQGAAAFEKSGAGGKMAGMIEWFLAIRINLPLNSQAHLVWPGLMAEEAISRYHLSVASNARVEGKVEALRNLHVHSHNIMGSILDLSASLTNWTESLSPRRAVVDRTVSTSAERQTMHRCTSHSLQHSGGQRAALATGMLQTVATAPNSQRLSTDHATLVAHAPCDPETLFQASSRSCGNKNNLAGLDRPPTAGRGSDLEQELDRELDLSILDETDLFHMHSRLDKIGIQASGKS